MVAPMFAFKTYWWEASSLITEQNLSITPSTSSEFWEHTTETTRLGFKANRLRWVQQQEFEGRAVRVIVNDRLGYASTTDTDTATKTLMGRAKRAAQHGRPANIIFPSTQIESLPLDLKLSALTQAGLKELGQEMIAVIRQAKPSPIVDLEIRRSREYLTIQNSLGGVVFSTANRLVADIWVERHLRGEALVIFDTFKTSRLDNDHCRFAEQIRQSLEWATRPATIKSGYYPVILSPRVVATLMAPLIVAFSGGRARSNSLLANKQNHPLFDPRLTLVDDGTLRDRPAGGTTDHEGVPTQRTPLIHNGIVTNFYYDLRTAAQANTHSTGNGWREQLAPPRPHSTNIVLNSGDASLQEMIAATDDGLLIDQLMGTSSDLSSRGAFSRSIALGHRIQHGQITGYIKGAALAGNLYELLNNLLALGNQSFWSGDVCTPYLHIAKLSISS